MTQTCTVEHYKDPDRPRRTLDGYTICGSCDRRLTENLNAIPKLFDDLVHLHTARRHGEGQKISGSSATRLLIDVQVADLRQEIQNAVIDWCVYATREAKAANAASGHRWLSMDVTAAAGWLQFNRDWCTRQEWAPDLVTTLQRLRSKAVRLLDPRPRQNFAIPGDDGLCVRDLDDTPCTGRLWVTIPLTEDEPAMIECDACLHAYNSMQWMRLGHLIEARRAAVA